MKTKVVFLIMLIFAALAPGVARAQIAAAELASLAIKQNQDTLKIKMSQPRTPTIGRFGARNRIAFTFEDSAAMSSLKSLSGKTRGGCVEKYEIQMFMRGAATIPGGGGVYAPAARPTLILIAYVENDVDAEVSVDYDEVTIRFFRIGAEPAQNRPLPFISIDEFGFSREGAHEIISIYTSAPITPSIFEAFKPRRLLLTFDSATMTDRARNQIKSYMQTPMHARAEAFDIAALPKPYESALTNREFHFVGYPPPLRSDDFSMFEPGYQSNSAAVSFFLEKDVDYTITRKGGRVLEIIFTKPPKVEPDACLAVPSADYDYSRPGALPEIYPVEDEEGRKFNVPLD
jgi:hypothetical protein